jgi:hypothetical protein
MLWVLYSYIDSKIFFSLQNEGCHCLGITWSQKVHAEYMKVNLYICYMLLLVVLINVNCFYPLVIFWLIVVCYLWVFYAEGESKRTIKVWHHILKIWGWHFIRYIIEIFNQGTFSSEYIGLFLLVVRPHVLIILIAIFFYKVIHLFLNMLFLH